MRTGNKKILTLALLCSALGFSFSVQAYDDKSSHGSICQAYYGSQEGDIGKYSTGAYNGAATARWVSCNVNRDNSTTTTGTYGYWVYIVQPANNTTTCYHNSARPDGTSMQLVGGSFTGTSGWLSLDSASSAAYGSDMVYCSLPSGARISTILTREDVATDVNN